MLFSKENLRGHYNWTPGTEKTVFEGNHSRRLFSRWNVDQVLFIINHLLDSSRDYSVDSGQRIEDLIINKLPFTSGSELTVFHWLQEQIATDKSVGSRVI